MLTAPMAQYIQEPTFANAMRSLPVVGQLMQPGETAAAGLLRRVGGLGEVARDLAYRLFHLCERKGWAQEALAYNGLVIAWPEISKLAQAQPAPGAITQAEMF